MSTCPKCHSTQVIPHVRIIDQAGHYIQLGVHVYEKPDALVFKGKHTAGMRSWICGACGYVESYVDNPQELYAVFAAAKAQRGTSE